MTWTIRQRSKVADLSAIVAGQGEPILLIHGVGLRAEAWNAQISALSERFQVTAVDMPGHGDSALPAGSLALEDYTNAIAAVFDRPALVVGHSMGAMIALDLAARYPQLVRGVAALNAVFERPAEAEHAVQARAAQLDGVTVADPSATLVRWFGNTPSPERSACKDWLCNVDPAGYRAAYRVFAHENGPSRDALAALTCPALFMTGAEEPNSTPAMSLVMAEIASNGRAVVLPEAAHMMPMTHTEQVNAALLDFATGVFA